MTLTTTLAGLLNGVTTNLLNVPLTSSLLSNPLGEVTNGLLRKFGKTQLSIVLHLPGQPTSSQHLFCHLVLMTSPDVC